MSNPWFRFYAEFLHDPKVRVMSDENQLRLVLLFCIRCNGSVTLQDKHVTFSMRISDEEWQQTKAVFIESGFIDSANNVLNWDRRQYISDSSAARVAKHRALHKPVTETKRNVTVTPPEQNRTDTEQIQKQSKSKSIAPSSLLASLGISDQLASDFTKLRSIKKSPITKTAMDGIDREAKKAGISFEDAIKVCCERGWAGFKAEWFYGNGAKTPDAVGQASRVREKLFGGQNAK